MQIDMFPDVSEIDRVGSVSADEQSRAACACVSENRGPSDDGSLSF